MIICVGSFCFFLSVKNRIYDIKQGTNNVNAPVHKQSEQFGKRIPNGQRSDNDYITAMKNSVPNGTTETMNTLISKNFGNLRYFVRKDENGIKHGCLYAESKVTISAILLEYSLTDYENAVSMSLESLTVIDQVTPKQITYTGEDAKYLLKLIYNGNYY